MIAVLLIVEVSVVDRLVGRGPEIETDRRSDTGRSPGALGHQDSDHLLLGVRIPGGAQAAVPAEPPGNRGHTVAPGDRGHAEDRARRPVRHGRP